MDLTYIRARAEQLTALRTAMPFSDSFWGTHCVDAQHFRASNSFLEVDNGYDHQALTDWILENGGTDLLDKLGNEDGAFGCDRVFVGMLPQRVVSRDLLDSALELMFLREAFRGKLPLRVVDVGAGYGRFAHRYYQAEPSALVCCLDAMPLSTAICEAYLNHRAILMEPGAARGAVVLPFHELTAGRVLDACTVRPGLAVNIHSWSECTSAAVDWWCELLGKMGVPYLFVIPHKPDFATMELAGIPSRNFRHILERWGWVLDHCWENWPPVASSRRPQGRFYYLFRRT